MADEKTVDELLEEAGVVGDASAAGGVEVKYLGRGEFEEFKRHGQKRKVAADEAERLLALDGDDGPLFEKV